MRFVNFSIFAVLTLLVLFGVESKSLEIAIIIMILLGAVAITTPSNIVFNKWNPMTDWLYWIRYALSISLLAKGYLLLGITYLILKLVMLAKYRLYAN